MEQYNIHQLIYTKLNPGESPFDKMDFHTAFYPLDFLSPTDVMVIENHIYIPQTNGFTSKQVVYFKSVKQETWLFVYDINLLPNEVDVHGRGGIFICHVMMFPQALWQKLPSPDKLMGILRGYMYKSRSELLNSKYIDKKTGNMLPIQLSAEKIDATDKRLAKLEGNFEIQMLLHLLDSLNTENKEQKFIVNAQESAARQVFNKLICYLPNILKVNIGWDTMYDGGRMMDNNKTYVAYLEKAPKGGAASTLIHLSKTKIELAKDFKVNKQESPYIKWIKGCSSSIDDYYYVEEAYKLSGALQAKVNYDLLDNWNVECFAAVNSELIGKLFRGKCRKEFKRRISKELSKIMPIKDKLLFFCQKLDLTMFASYLFTIVYNSKLSTKLLEKGIPAKYISYNPLLILIEQLWKIKKFDIESFNQLNQSQKLQLNKYVLKSKAYKEPWYLELIKSDEALLNYFQIEYPKPKRIIKLFRTVLKMNEAEINHSGFGLEIIRKVLYFRMAHFFSKIFGRKKKR